MSLETLGIALQASNYVMGSKVETRNNLSLYHPELLSGHAQTLVSYPEIYAQYPSKMVLPAPQVYPNDQKSVVVGLAVSNPTRNPTAGDLFTAKVRVRARVRGENACSAV
jgi:hypothetical protein